MSSKLATVAAILGSLLFTFPASAALVVRDLNASGDGLLTYDTTTGLEWLDLSVSLGTAPLSVTAVYPGFRMAYRAEVEALLLSAGIDPAHLGDGQPYPGDLAAGHLLRDTIGVTVSAFGGIVQQIHGRVLRSSNDRYDLYLLEIRTPPAGFPGTSSQFVELGNTLSSWQSNHADFLVRTGVAQTPEPATFGLTAMTLLLAGYRRRRG